MFDKFSQHKGRQKNQHILSTPKHEVVQQILHYMVCTCTCHYSVVDTIYQMVHLFWTRSPLIKLWPFFLSSVTVSVVDCGVPPTLDNGRLTETPPASTNLGSTVTYVCDDGYKFEEGSPMSRTCLETGEWSNEDIKCLQDNTEGITRLDQLINSALTLILSIFTHVLYMQNHAPRMATSVA